MIKLTSIDIYDVPTLAYNGNGSTGGTLPASSTQYEPGVSITVPDNTGFLYRVGYTFIGWNTEADGYGTYYYPGDTLIIGIIDITLYAIWSVIPGTYITLRSRALVLSIWTPLQVGSAAKQLYDSWRALRLWCFGNSKTGPLSQAYINTNTVFTTKTELATKRSLFSAYKDAEAVMTNAIATREADLAEQTATALIPYKTPKYLGVCKVLSSNSASYILYHVDEEGDITTDDITGTANVGDFILEPFAYDLEEEGLYYWDGYSWVQSSDIRYTNACFTDLFNLKTGGIDIDGYTITLQAIIRNLLVYALELLPGGSLRAQYDEEGNPPESGKGFWLGHDGTVKAVQALLVDVVLSGSLLTGESISGTHFEIVDDSIILWSGSSKTAPAVGDRKIALDASGGITTSYCASAGTWITETTLLPGSGLTVDSTIKGAIINSYKVQLSSTSWLNTTLLADYVYRFELIGGYEGSSSCGLVGYVMARNIYIQTVLFDTGGAASIDLFMRISTTHKIELRADNSSQVVWVSITRVF